MHRVGPNGNGKSTLLRDIVRSLGGGVGYIEVQSMQTELQSYIWHHGMAG